MGEKFFTISYDDGLEQDREIIRLMEQYGIRGTFNISSGLFGKKTYIKRLGDLGYKEEETCPAGSRVHVPHNILDEKAAVELYSHPNVEVASHSVHHLNQSKMTREEVKEEVTEDIRQLSELFGYRVRGHAFPYGSYNENVLDALKDAGIYYARKVSMLQKPKNFAFDRSQILLMPTCWHLDSFAEKLLDQFIAAPAGKEDQVFYMWGHGYELDYGSKRGNYGHLEHLFRKVSEAKDVICVTNRELYEA